MSISQKSLRVLCNGSKTRERVAVIGGGIVGLAHAWSAAQRGFKVYLFERNKHTQGASVRNFGMVWPIGQPNGPNYRTALQSRERWQQLISSCELEARETGSLHLAYREDELAVLEEFADMAPILGYQCRLMMPDEVCKISPAAKRAGLLGGLWSPTEWNVDPRQVIRKMPGWLAEKYQVELHYGVSIDRVVEGRVMASDGTLWNVDRTIVATGSDFQALFPEVYVDAGLGLCKLQMLRTSVQPAGWKLGPMIAGGLTLRHYESFAICKSLATLKQRVCRETPELNQYGIHVMAAQNCRGEVILGDSHEYNEDISPFDKSIIEELILRELRGLIEIPDWSIQERWHGIYATLPKSLQFVKQIGEKTHIVIATGGCGMTMSFGHAEQLWSTWTENYTPNLSDRVADLSVVSGS